MTKTAKQLLERVASWPDEDIEKLEQAARDIEAWRSGVYRLSDEERAAVRVGMDAARRGDFVPDGEMEAFYRSFRKA